MKENPDSEPKIVRVFKGRDEVEWSYRYGSSRDDVDFCCNSHAQWSNIPIPLPTGNPRPRDEDLDDGAEPLIRESSP